jgi:peptidoglycan/xylan/chitin deacetylase (PgdA/CDA1 family)
MMYVTKIPILAYHRIVKDNEPPDPYRLSVSVSQFEAQMRYLSDQGYKCVNVSDMFDPAGNQVTLPRKAFALTFDDGYEDFLTHAYPILRHYGFSATVFLVANLIGKRSIWDGKLASPLLSWRHIEMLSRDSIEFGSHTCSHPYLPVILPKQIHHELLCSRNRLEDGLGKAVPLVSYPYGGTSSLVQQIAEEVGYRAAFGVDNGRASRFNILRSECTSDASLKQFAFRLSPFYRHMHWWRMYMRKKLRPLKMSLWMSCVIPVLLDDSGEVAVDHFRPFL